MPSTKNRACAGKSTYDNKHDAKNSMIWFMKKSGVYSNSMEVYKCKFCNAFHFGHKRMRRSKSR
jgi:hypothetical protein